MELTLLFDHRFYRNDHGEIFSLKGYSYSFFRERYLQVFDRISILSRVFESDDNEPVEECSQDGNVKVVSLGNWEGAFASLRKRRSIVRKFDEYLPANSAVIMIVPGIVGTFLYKHLLRRNRPYGVEVVGDPRDTFSVGSVKHPLRPFLCWWFAHHLRQQCAGAAAASYVTRQALQNRYPCPNYSIGVSDVVISDASLLSAPRPSPSCDQPLTIITVGTLEQLYKAPDLLIDSFHICIRNGLDAYLILVGDGRYRPELERLAASLGLAERVRFMGQLSSGKAVRDQLDRADLFILPSRQEGLPRAMVEAMARALPCIGSTVGGIPELLAPEDMIPPNDAVALAQKICEVANDPERMAQMSARNLEKAREYHEDILREHRLAFYTHVKEKTEVWSKAEAR
jgi:glycosyltransferase involved in cell wall biosynthesis